MTNHVNLVVKHENTSTLKKGKQELVFLKQRAADTAVQTECEVVVDVYDPLIQILCTK